MDFYGFSLSEIGYGFLICFILFISYKLAIKKTEWEQEQRNAPIKIAENLEKLANSQNTNAELLARIEKLEQALQEQKK